MRLCLDTNRYCDFMRGHPEAVALLRQAEEILLPFVVVAELRAGFLGGTKGRANEGLLVRFINSPRVTIVYANDETTQHFARLVQQLRLQGTPLPTHDVWIACLAIQHNAILFSRDRHFDVLPQLARAGEA